MKTLSLSILSFCVTLGVVWAVPLLSAADTEAAKGEKKASVELSHTTRPDVALPAGRPEQVERLIRQLGDDRYEVREEAQKKLAKLGFAAYEALREATQDDDLEIAARARYLLRLISVDLTRPGDPAEVVSLLGQFHLIEHREQIARLEKLSALADGRGIGPLCRVIRFEPSVVLAKQAALVMLKQYPTKQVPLKRLSELLRENLKDSRRLPSRWMLSYAKFQDAPDDAWREWKQWMKHERELLKQEDQGTNSRIVSELASQQIGWVEKMNGTDQQMVEQILALIEARRGQQADTKPLVAWTVEQKAWNALGISVLDFAGRLAGDPRSVIYELAEKYAELGQNALAETAAEKAFQLGGYSPAMGQRIHFACAEQLQSDGHFNWAEREYRHVIRSGDMEDYNVHAAYSYLAAMFHDQGENQRAVELLEKYIKKLREYLKSEKNKGKSAVSGELIKPLTARLDYYLACQYRDSGDPAKQRLALEAGLAIDPTNPDLLIAAFNLPNTDPLFQKRVRELLKKTALTMRMRVVTSSDRATACNDLAWLIAKTEGDFSEAIRLSKQSLREQPDNGAFHDTLARCYYANGNYAKAMEHQIKAVEFEPHSGLIAEQLKLFRKTYKEKLGKPAPKPGPSKKKAQGFPAMERTDSRFSDFDAAEWVLPR